MYKVFTIAIISLVLTSGTGVDGGGCNSGNADCDYYATVIDMTGLDGCGYMLLLRDGTKLLPANIDEYQDQLSEGLVVKISYTSLDDQMSICMAQDVIGRVTCLEPVSSTHVDCPKVKDPVEIDWMRKVLMELNPRRIEKHHTGDVYVYHFIVDHHTRTIYTCEGVEICSVTRENPSMCEHFTGANTDIEVIYVVNN